jgi:hypothetical protein
LKNSIVPQDRRHRLVDPYRDFKIHDDDDYENEEFEDEFSVKESGKEKTGFSAMKNQYYHQKRLIIFTVVMVVVSILSISLGVSLGTKKSDQASKNSEEIDTTNDNSIDSVVHAPPPNIHNLCTIANIATTEGHDKCAHVCSFASCCMAPGNQSCFLQQEEICGLYSPCGILHSQTEGEDYDDSPKQPIKKDENLVAPAPDNLLFVCSEESLSSVTGFLSCQASCHSGECCTTKNSPEMIAQSPYAIRPCRDTHPNICLGYKACENLYNNTSGDNHNSNTETPKVVPQTKDIIKTLHEICNPETLSSSSNPKKECEHLCQSRSCCYTSKIARNCYDDNEVWCEKYSPCKNLLPKKQTDPPDDLGDDNLPGNQ